MGTAEKSLSTLKIIPDAGAEPSADAGAQQRLEALIRAPYPDDMGSGVRSFVGASPPEAEPLDVPPPVGQSSPDPNDPLSSRNMNQFIPDTVDQGDPEAARTFITDSNNRAYQDDIDKAQRELNDALGEGKSQDEIEQLTQQLANIQERRDRQTQEAITQFDTYYDQALDEVQNDSTKDGLSDPEKMRLASTKACEQYNDWIFYANSEGETITDPTTLFATGAGDEGKVDINDIRQGGLGDCSVLAAISAIVQHHPEMIERIIQDNGDGTYTVTLHREVPDDSFLGRLFGRTKDEEVQVTVDLTFPSNGRSCNPSGDSEDGKAEVWPQVLEKAIAKLNGSYGAIDGVYPRDMLYALTGQKPQNGTNDRVLFRRNRKSLGSGQTGRDGHGWGKRRPKGHAERIQPRRHARLRGQGDQDGGRRQEISHSLQSAGGGQGGGPGGRNNESDTARKSHRAERTADSEIAVGFSCAAARQAFPPAPWGGVVLGWLLLLYQRSGGVQRSPMNLNQNAADKPKNETRISVGFHSDHGAVCVMAARRPESKTHRFGPRPMYRRPPQPPRPW